MRWSHPRTGRISTTPAEEGLEKEETLEDGQMIGGRGRLTDQMIDSLQIYYGMAIRSHQNDLQGMAKAIWASLMHRVSTDAKPQHQFCPTGADSWCTCGWQRMQATGAEYQHHDVIPQAIFKCIKPIYISLSAKALLSWYVRGATQNQNECLNGMIWAYAPKQGFAS